MKKPNIFWHMIRWGFVSGTILGVVYLVMLETQVFDAIKILTYLDIWIFAAIFGGGIVLGFVDAVLLWFLIRFLPQILKSDLTQSDRFSVYAMILIIACNGWIGWLYLDSIATGIRYFSDMRLFSLYPSLLGAMGATFAAHRYLVHLHLYYEQGDKEKRKTKPKHDMSHLEDAAEASEFNEAEDASMQRFNE